MQVPPKQKPDVDGDGLRARIAHYDDAESANRALLALDAGHIGSWVWDMVQGHVIGDHTIASLFGLDFDAQPWPEDDVFGMIHTDDVDDVKTALQGAVDNNSIFMAEFRQPRVDPETGVPFVRWLSGRGNVTEYNADGSPNRMIGVNWDITEQKTREEQRVLLAAEMDHRVKNAFAVIRALINLGLRVDDTKETFAEGLRRQVEAMATAHAISAKMARDTDMPNAPVPVDALFEVALAPWIETTINPDCEVIIQSDPSFVIHPRLVSSLSMMVYELTINATKYGALGERGGTLTIKVVKGAGDTIKMTWDEVCTHPPIKPTKAAGFGSRLIAQCAAMLGEVIHQETTETGLSLALVINTPKT